MYQIKNKIKCIFILYQIFGKNDPGTSPDRGLASIWGRCLGLDRAFGLAGKAKTRPEAGFLSAYFIVALTCTLLSRGIYQRFRLRTNQTISH